MREQTVDLGVRPFPHQREAHALRLACRFLVLVWHRRAGKTVFAVLELVLAALAFDGTRGRYGYIGPYLNQAKQVAWDYLKAFCRAIPGAAFNETELTVTLPNGASIRVYGADKPDSFRGLYFDGVVLDEVADMRPNVWGEILRPALADRQGWAIFIGTPKGTNLFSELYQRARKGENGWAADLRRARDTNVVPEAELAAARAEMTDAEWAQEFECDFAASVANVLCPLPVVLAAQERRIGEAAFDFAPKVLGIDVARYGDDRTVFAPRQGLMAYRMRVFRGLDNMAVAGQAAEYISKWHPDAVFIDASPISAGVIDRLRQLGFQVSEVHFGGTPLDPRFQDRRAEMWWGLADWLKGGDSCLPDDPELITDLTAPTYTYANARGKLALESKDDLKDRGLKSPDLGDALALTFAAPVPIKTALDRERDLDRQRRRGRGDPWGDDRRSDG